MKRVLVLVVALFTMVAFASTGLAQAPAKTEKPAAAAPAAAPASEKAAPAKAEKPKAPKPMKYAGTVAAYEAGKMIKVKDAKGKEMSFDVAADAKLKGEIKNGAKVNIVYKKDGDKMVATSISVPAPKKEAPKKEAPKQTEAPKK